jgi:hypothetical protein
MEMGSAYATCLSQYTLQHACAEIKWDGPSSELHLETINVVFVCRHSRNNVAVSQQGKASGQRISHSYSKAADDACYVKVVIKASSFGVFLVSNPF